MQRLIHKEVELEKELKAADKVVISETKKKFKRSMELADMLWSTSREMGHYRSCHIYKEKFLLQN
jgi:hypothetical protein